MKNLLIAFGVMALVFFGCKKDESNDLDNNSTNNSDVYTTVTVNHFGFDFSAGKADTVNYNNNDGETIMWNPSFAFDSIYPSYSSYIWWRNSQIDTVNYMNQTKDMGIVDLESITVAPTQWDTTTNILPLIVGHTIVAKCFDGYVKFKVISTDTSMMWPATIQYYFSNTSTFNH